MAFALLLTRYDYMCVVYIMVTAWSWCVGSLLVHFIVLKQLVKFCSIEFCVTGIFKNDKRGAVQP
jgi:hypothetical protein